jgi:hypothetical protein
MIVRLDRHALRALAGLVVCRWFYTVGHANYQ